MHKCFSHLWYTVKSSLSLSLFPRPCHNTFNPSHWKTTTLITMQHHYQPYPSKSNHTASTILCHYVDVDIHVAHRTAKHNLYHHRCLVPTHPRIEGAIARPPPRFGLHSSRWLTLPFTLVGGGPRTPPHCSFASRDTLPTSPCPASSLNPLASRTSLSSSGVSPCTSLENRAVVVRLLLHHRHFLRPNLPHRQKHLLHCAETSKQLVYLEHGTSS